MYMNVFLLFILGIAQYKMDINISDIDNAIDLQNLINEVCVHVCVGICIYSILKCMHKLNWFILD